MTSTDALFQTLRSTTNIKLKELSKQRTTFDHNKELVLLSANTEPVAQEALKVLHDGLRILPRYQTEGKHTIFNENLAQFLEQTKHDISISRAFLKDWESKLRRELDLQSLKYEYTSLYGRLVTEWLEDSPADAEAPSSIRDMENHRAEWESNVFNARQTSQDGITNYLDRLFCSSKDSRQTLETLRKDVHAFEATLNKSGQFDEDSMRNCVRGLLASDLLTEEKRAALKHISSSKSSITDITDVLNIRISSIEDWSWDGVVLAEQRRQRGGRYRVFHDEDLLDSLLLQYIGTKWSVKFKNALAVLSRPKITAMTSSYRTRRKHFIGEEGKLSVSEKRKGLLENENFLSQLLQRENEVFRGYDDDDDENEGDSDVTFRKSPSEMKQSLLHLLRTEIVLNSRLNKDLTIIRSDFKSFGPSIPHSTIMAVMRFFGVSHKWLNFFKKALEVPLKFANDGPNAQVRKCLRGTPMSSPLADVMTEVVLFCMDSVIAHHSDEAILYRLHDDFWIWGPNQACVRAWDAITTFARLMGLQINEEKSGSVTISHEKVTNAAISPHKRPTRPDDRTQESLPRGDIAWGFLILDSATGRFKVDKPLVSKHIQELSHQLDSKRSILGYIKTWNSYASFFASMCGKPANCLGLDHNDMILEVYQRVQKQLFGDSNVTDYLKNEITKRFDVKDVPDGFLYFPISLGGLDLRNPFIPLLQVRPTLVKDPNTIMDAFFSIEEAAFRQAKIAYEHRQTLNPKLQNFDMDFKEYTRFREESSKQLLYAYEKLLREPEVKTVRLTHNIREEPGGSAKRHAVESPPARLSSPGGPRTAAAVWEPYVDGKQLSAYEKWVLQLYGGEMEERFGGLCAVEKRLLPTGLVHLFKQRRIKW